MSSLNKVFLIGNLTRNVEIRYTPSGMAIGEFGLAINRKIIAKDGKEQTETVFVDISIWGKQAENCSRFIAKGSPVMIEGRLSLDQWKDKEGANHSKIKVTAERVQFLAAPH